MITQFIGNIFDLIEPGHVFVLSGKTIDGASGLEINFRSSKDEESQVPLHLSVRFDDDIIVRNTRIDGSWGNEERDGNLSPFTAPNPIVPGETFKIYVLVGDHRFHIAINDEPYCTYYIRMPLQTIRTIQITRDVQSVVQVDHRAVYPTPFPAIQLDENRIEFSNDIPKKFQPGHMMVISAIPFGNPRGTFIIRFTEGASKKQALHFNARFDPHYVVVRNAMNDDLSFHQGREERDGGFPFFIDEQFKLAIGFTETEFKFAVNGTEFGTFEYRTPNLLDRLNGLKIAGGNGLHMEVTSVDHMNSGSPDCEGFETYSHPDVQIV